ncbi:MAG: acetylglutamate kinase [Bacteroidetes bacterium]|nr:acetylglutamate kinase [Bacteroidota bacterium]
MTELVLIKYGGNAMRDDALTHEIVARIGQLRDRGMRVIVVHGGGPFIEEMFTRTGMKSEFVGGHRKTTPEALRYVEMVLKGQVNGKLVQLCNATGQRAVGLSGKDGRMVTAVPRVHTEIVDGLEKNVDLGRVGDVAAVDTTLLELLLQKDFLPIVTCIASDAEGMDYNINADMFAGHLAGALRVDHYLVLTDVDGVLTDISDPTSLVSEMSVAEVREDRASIISGGMIPKLESCLLALEKGAKCARIINGTEPDQLVEAVSEKQCGTKIYS